MGLCVTETIIEVKILKTQTTEITKVILMPRRYLVRLALKDLLLYRISLSVLEINFRGMISEILLN